MISRKWADMFLELLCGEMLHNGANLSDRVVKEVIDLKTIIGQGYSKDLIIEHVEERREIASSLPDGQLRQELMACWRIMAELVVDLER